MKNLVLLIALVLFSCSKEEILEVGTGIYKGKIPAENADYIEATLTLSEDNQYFLRQIKIKGKNSEYLDDESGTYLFKKKVPKSVTEFKLGMLILMKEEDPIMKFKILSDKKLEILDLNENQVDIKKTYALKKVE